MLIKPSLESSLALNPILWFRVQSSQPTLRWQADANAAGSFWRAGVWKQVARGQLQLHEDERVGACDAVLRIAQVVLQSLALVTAELAPPWPSGALLAQREDVIAEGRDGKFRALV